MKECSVSYFNERERGRVREREHVVRVSSTKFAFGSHILLAAAIDHAEALRNGPPTVRRKNSDQSERRHHTPRTAGI